MSDRYRVIGMMSGTSLDGLDICLTDFIRRGESWQFKIHKGITVAYNDEWKARLGFNPDLSANSLLKLDHQYAQWLGTQVNAFLDAQNLDSGEIDLVASHGHTLYHQPENGITFQLGCGPEIMSVTGITTVTDFRRKDVNLGGQGAPLVPIGDRLLFGDYDACLNLGGFANISFEEGHKRIAYDICPVNYVMNHLARSEGKDYDAGGAIAQSGECNDELLDTLNSLDFYDAPPPKSLGAEWVNDYVYPILKASKISNKDQLSTFTEHVALQIAESLNRIGARRCLVTGGGSYNEFLIKRIGLHTSCEPVMPDDELINYKEALVFGLLGVLRLRGEINILASVTGAKRDHSSGLVYSV